jgi:hypothetical protein
LYSDYLGSYFPLTASHLDATYALRPQWRPAQHTPHERVGTKGGSARGEKQLLKTFMTK